MSFCLFFLLPSSKETRYAFNLQLPVSHDAMSWHPVDRKSTSNDRAHENQEIWKREYKIIRSFNRYLLTRFYARYRLLISVFIIQCRLKKWTNNTICIFSCVYGPSLQIQRQHYKASCACWKRDYLKTQSQLNYYLEILFYPKRNSKMCTKTSHALAKAIALFESTSDSVNPLLGKSTERAAVGHDILTSHADIVRSTHRIRPYCHRRFTRNGRGHITHRLTGGLLSLCRIAWRCRVAQAVTCVMVAL